MGQRDLAIGNVAEAKKWVASAIASLNSIIGFNGKRDGITSLPAFKAQLFHFHIELGPQPSLLKQFLRLLPVVRDDPALLLLMEVRFKYFDILSVFNRADQIFIDAPAGGGAEDVGQAPAFTPRNRNGTIGITPYYESAGPLIRSHCLIHEAAHFLSDDFQDWAYRFREPGVNPRGYIDLDVLHAIRNPDSYAYFALQTAKNINRTISQDE